MIARGLVVFGHAGFSQDLRDSMAAALTDWGSSILVDIVHVASPPADFNPLSPLEVYEPDFVILLPGAGSKKTF